MVINENGTLSKVVYFSVSKNSKDAQSLTIGLETERG